jgi:NADPH-dependent glutamate synthase beta subunit-like oxidoreductase/coenzyme F420-reducing hydrogenase delta subunit/Pyruvate/2-oxoacid:ferredoxin oxidoreductase delta subunit
MKNSCLVIGGSLQGVRVALDLAETGQHVYLVGGESSLGSDAVLDGDLSSSGLSRHEVVPLLLKAITHPGIHVLTGSKLKELKGRNGNFKARVFRSPNYIREEICTGCGACVEECPVTLDRSHGPGLEGRKAVDFSSNLSVPFVPSIVKERRAPCVETCPAHINIQGYVALVSKGRFKEAYDLIRETIPFPSVCGRVCFHPCETECNRREVDEPIAINNLKRYVSDYVHREGLLESPVSLKPKGPKVAIIGSGPAGLTAAHDLIRMGYRPTVFEALSEPGGMLRVGIVSYRLPRDILDREIEDLEKLGVEIKTGCRIGVDVSIEKLFSKGYKSVFLSTGAHGARKLNIEGENIKGVVDGVTFLREVNLKGKFKLNKNVIVIGGGNVALDCARAALRVGAKKVKVVCLESREEMPSHEWEILEAIEEGIDLMPSLGPKRILGKDGRVTGLETLKVKHVFDEMGRFNPAFHEGTEGKVTGDSMIVAIGQMAEEGYLEGVKKVERDERGRLKIEERTLMTTRPGLFAGGDLKTGPLSVIAAIADGKRAAIAIDRYMRKDKSEMPEWNPIRADRDEKYVVPKGVKKAKRVVPERLGPSKRVKGFEEVEKTITREMAIEEATRCLNCASCSECMECVRACEVLNAVDHDQLPEEIEISADHVVLAADSFSGKPDVKVPDDLFPLLGIELNKKGMPVTPRLWDGSLETTRRGIFTAISSGKKKDFTGEMVTASAITSEIAGITGVTQPVGLSRSVSVPKTERPTRIGAIVCRCGGGISDYVDVGRVADRLGEIEPVSFTGTIDYACSAEGIQKMKSIVQSEGLDSLVLAACSCCSLEQICSNCSHQRIRQKEAIFNNVGLPSRQVELVNIREHSAWVHAEDPEAATDKAFHIARTGVASMLGRDIADERGTREIGKRVTVIGDGTVAFSCASTLVSLGFDAVLLRTGTMTGKTNGEPVLDGSVSPEKIIENANVIDIDGRIGDFSVRFMTAGVENVATCDFVVRADDKTSRGGKRSGSSRFSILEPFGDRKRGIFRATGKGGKDDSWNRMVGKAVAMQVCVERGSGIVAETSWAPVVNTYWCRGCGTCVEVCPFDACELVDSDRSVQVSHVDALSCRGCELCVLHCPTGSMQSGYFDERNMDRLLEAMLSEPNGDGEANVLIFACHWCHYGGTDIHGRGRFEYPPGVRLIRMTCTGRIGPNFILKAFQHGADGVLVMGCPEGECHYEEGNSNYKEQEEIVLNLLETMGIPSSHYQTMWITPDEGETFISGVRDFVEKLGGGNHHER